LLGKNKKHGFNRLNLLEKRFRRFFKAWPGKQTALKQAALSAESDNIPSWFPHPRRSSGYPVGPT